MILLVGHLGNMGRRYAAILKMLHVDYVGYDSRDPLSTMMEAENAEKIIVATPTHTHLQVLEKLNFYRDSESKPVDVLCEKPVVKKLEEFEKLKALRGLRIFSVNQYAHLPEYERFRTSQGRTHYNYFRHGDDGLHWDCFQLFALAQSKLTLNESSAVWKCRINGVEISPAGMDMAYVQMVADFIGPMKRVCDLFTTEVTTKKVLRWISEEQIPG